MLKGICLCGFYVQSCESNTRLGTVLLTWGGLPGRQVWQLHERLPSYPHKGAAHMAHGRLLEHRHSEGQCPAADVWLAFQAAVNAYR